MLQENVVYKTFCVLYSCCGVVSLIFFCFVFFERSLDEKREEKTRHFFFFFFQVGGQDKLTSLYNFKSSPPLAVAHTATITITTLKKT